MSRIRDAPRMLLLEAPPPKKKKTADGLGASPQILAIKASPETPEPNPLQGGIVEDTSDEEEEARAAYARKGKCVMDEFLPIVDPPEERPEPHPK